RHGPGRPRRRGARRRALRRHHPAHPGRQRRGAPSNEDQRMRIARWLIADPADGPGTVHEGFVIGDRVVPFPDALTVADVLRRGLADAHGLYARVAGASSAGEADAGSALAEVTLLAPLVPASVRDFVAFEEHVEGVSA